MMATKLFHPVRLVLLSVLLKMSPASPVELQGDRQQLCSLGDDYGSEYSVLMCQDGVWPGTNEAVLPFRDIIVDILRIQHIAVNSRDFQTLFNAKTKDLQMRNLQTHDGAAFPLRGFLRGLAKETVEQLVMSDVKIGSIGQHDFEGFSSLKYFRIEQGSLQTIHPDSFQHFSTGLASLVILRDAALTSFPWASLRSFTNTLKTLTLGSSQLAEINFQGSPSNMRFAALDNFSIAGSTLKTIPKNVLDAIIYDNKATLTRISFGYNDNMCSESASLAPLLQWIKTSSKPNDMLDATCFLDDGSVSHNRGNAQSWINCREVICQTNSQ